MKFKELLSYSIIICSLLGCSTSPRDQQSELEEKKNNILSKSIIHYLFDNSTEINLSLTGYSGGSDKLYGVLSNPIKHTIQMLWTKLKDIGFSGYDVSLLNNPTVQWYSEFNGVYSHTSLATPQTEKDFHHRFVEYLVNSDASLLLSKPYFPFQHPSEAPFMYTTTLFGLKFNNKALTFVRTLENTYIPVLSDNFRPAPRNAGSFHVPLKIDTDIPVSQEQIDEWNQVFINALKEDPFFKQFFAPEALSDGSGSVSLSGARKGSTSVDATSFNVNGVSGSHDLGLPLYVQVKGSVDHGKSTNLTTGTVAYKVGNTVVGAIQSYANSGAGFGIEGHQLETSVVVSHSFGSFFLEGQLGSVSAKDVHFKDWSGIRSQVTVGIDTPWVSPFVQFTHRDFGDKTDTATYAGLEVDLSELKAESYSFSTHLLTKVGHHTVHGLTGAVEWYGSLNLYSGLSFTSYLTIDTMAEPAAGLKFMVNR